MVAALGAPGAAPARAQDGGVIAATVTVSGLEARLIAPREVDAGRPFLALALVRYAGPGALEGVEASLAYNHTGMRSLGPAQRRLGTLHPGRWRWAVWALRAEAPGDYVLVAHVAGRDRLIGDRLEAESAAALVRVR
ncbi:MAG TPA: hypothetical protein VNM43_01080 [Dehalococcoidia bacterium]|nr:hypothetical protein [Dehalococcoidia bacterium]